MSITNMNNTQVALKFAEHKTKGKGSNMFIDDDTIYSYGYHFPIARHTGIYFRDHIHTDMNDLEIVLFNSRRYSNSTSKHQAKVRSALSDCHILEVNLGNGPTQWRTELNDRLVASVDKHKRARLESMKTYYLQEISSLLKQQAMLNKYISKQPITSSEIPF